jgi:hypothetical protein
MADLREMKTAQGGTTNEWLSLAQGVRGKDSEWINQRENEGVNESSHVETGGSRGNGCTECIYQRLTPGVKERNPFR